MGSCNRGEWEAQVDAHKRPPTTKPDRLLSVDSTNRCDFSIAFQEALHQNAVPGPVESLHHHARHSAEVGEDVQDREDDKD